MSDAGKAIFLSYASQDAEAARKICDALRGAGLEVWFDVDGGLEHGDEWDAKIRRQIKECVLFIPIISANTQARLEGYFRIEWELAAQRALGIAAGVPFILPVVIDDTRDSGALVPDRFRMVQWTRLRAGEVTPEVRQRFVKLWSTRLGASQRADDVAPVSSSVGEPGATGTTAPHMNGARHGRRLFIPVAIAIVGLTGAIVWRRLLPVAKSGAAPVAADKAPAGATFPHDPDLKRVYELLYNVVDGIAEDFALMDDLVKPLLAARPNDPEVVTVAAELAQEFVTRGFDVSPSRRAQAQRLTERAVQLAPDNPEALAALGYYLTTTGTQLGRAEDLLRRAIKLKPMEPRFHCFLYQVLIASRKPPDEIDAFGAQLAASFPNYPMAAYSIASHYVSTGNLAAGEQWIDKTLALAPVPYAITLKARLMLEVHGDVPGMERALERMPERQRTNARLVNAYAVLATVTGRTDSARRVLEATADDWLADGSYLFPKAMLAGQLEQIDGHDDIARRQFEAALAEVKRKLAADPTDLRPIRAELWIHLGLGHRDEARATLRTNLEKAPRPYHWNMRFTWWTSALRACLLLDQREQALALLKEATAEAEGRLLLRNLFAVDPKMAPFHADREIMALLGEPPARQTE